MIHFLPRFPKGLNYPRGIARLYKCAATLWIMLSAFDLWTRLEHGRQSTIDTLISGLQWTLIPPFVVYCFGAGLAWAIAGFKK